MCSEMDFDVETIAETTLDEIKEMYESADSAHDFSHILRVYKSAQKIGKAEGADMQVLLYAALLHDVGAKSKLAEKSAESDALRLGIAEDFLKKKGLPEDLRTRSFMPSTSTASQRHSPGHKGGQDSPGCGPAGCNGRNWNSESLHDWRFHGKKVLQSR